MKIHRTKKDKKRGQERGGGVRATKVDTYIYEHKKGKLKFDNKKKPEK